VSAADARLVLCAIALAACGPQARDSSVADGLPANLGLGRAAAPSEIAATDIEITPDGAGLPAGSGTPEQGKPVFLVNCATCHGNDGEGRPPLYPQLIGGARGSFNFADDPKMTRTIGNYWPYATTIFDYVRRAMPFGAPRSLTDDQYYAVTAYLLEREGIIAPGTVIDAKSLPAVRMPARAHFVVDDRDGSMGGKAVR
jgi:S-disulfanyl-L-cysteine oxidoreductase SoxD